MPFDTGKLSILESEKLMANASWIERYLIGIAYNAFASPRICPSYDILDQHIASYDMPSVVDRLNAKLKEFRFQSVQGSTLPDLIKNLRILLRMNPQRSNALDWLVGNENDLVWEQAKLNEAWKLDDEALIAFCMELSAKLKAQE